MTIAPDARLLGAVAGWTGLAAATVAVPPLWPALLAGAVLLLGLCLQDALLLWRRPVLVVARRLPERGFVGRPSELALVVENPGPRAVRLDALEELPRELAAEDPEFSGVVVPARDRRELAYPVTPELRGDLELGPAVLLERSPLGLWRRRSLGPTGDVLRVYPDTSRFLRPEALDPKRVLAAIGVKPARQHALGIEGLGAQEARGVRVDPQHVARRPEAAPTPEPEG